MRALGFRVVREGQGAPVRRDPAPSRLAYRWQRMMLRPLFRRIVRVGLPVAAVALGMGLWALSPANRATLSAQVATIRAEIVSRPEFMVSGIEILGADAALTQAVAGLVTVSFPVSSFDLDLDLLHADVSALSAVKSATVAIRPGGVLQVAVTERQPVAVWRHSDGLRLIDAEGVLTGMIMDRADRPDLPLIAGDGAMEVIGEALALFTAAEPVGERVRGLVRMGKRRWDLVLDRDQRILLPEQAPVAALEHVLALHQVQGLLERDVTVVDMRDTDRPTLRLGTSAVNALRNVVDVAALEGAGN